MEMSLRPDSSSVSAQRFMYQLEREFPAQLLVSTKKTGRTGKSQRRLCVLSPGTEVSSCPSDRLLPCRKGESTRAKLARKGVCVELGVRKLADIVRLRSRTVLEQLRRLQVWAAKRGFDLQSTQASLSPVLAVCPQCGHKGLSLTSPAKQQFSPDFGTQARAFPMAKRPPHPSSSTILDLPEAPDLSAISSDPFSSHCSDPKVQTDTSTDWKVSRANRTDIQSRHKAVKGSYWGLRRERSSEVEVGVERLARLVRGRVQRAFDMTLLSRSPKKRNGS